MDPTMWTLIRGRANPKQLFLITPGERQLDLHNSFPAKQGWLAAFDNGFNNARTDPAQFDKLGQLLAAASLARCDFLKRYMG